MTAGYRDAAGWNAAPRQRPAATAAGGDTHSPSVTTGARRLQPHPWAPGSEGQLGPTNSHAVEAQAPARPSAQTWGEGQEAGVQKGRRTRPLTNTPRSTRAPGASSPWLRSSGHQVCRAHARFPQASMTAARLTFKVARARAPRRPR